MCQSVAKCAHWIVREEHGALLTERSGRALPELLKVALAQVDKTKVVQRHSLADVVSGRPDICAPPVHEIIQ